MKKEDEKKIVNFPIKNNIKNSKKKFKRISLEMQKTDIYFIQIDVPISNNSNENSMAIKLAWSIINSDSKDNEKFRIGDGFKNKILKTELIKCIPK